MEYCYSCNGYGKCTQCKVQFKVDYNRLGLTSFEKMQRTAEGKAIHARYCPECNDHPDKTVKHTNRGEYFVEEPSIPEWVTCWHMPKHPAEARSPIPRSDLFIGMHVSQSLLGSGVVRGYQKQNFKPLVEFDDRSVYVPALSLTIMKDAEGKVVYDTTPYKPKPDHKPLSNRGLHIGDRVAHEYSGRGSVIGFAYDNKFPLVEFDLNIPSSYTQKSGEFEIDGRMGATNKCAYIDPKHIAKIPNAIPTYTISDVTDPVMEKYGYTVGQRVMSVDGGKGTVIGFGKNHRDECVLVQYDEARKGRHDGNSRSEVSGRVGKEGHCYYEALPDIGKLLQYKLKESKVLKEGMRVRCIRSIGCACHLKGDIDKVGILKEASDYDTQPWYVDIDKTGHIELETSMLCCSDCVEAL